MVTGEDLRNVSGHSAGQAGALTLEQGRKESPGMVVMPAGRSQYREMIPSVGEGSFAFTPFGLEGLSGFPQVMKAAEEGKPKLCTVF